MEEKSLASQAQADKKGQLEEDLDMAHQHVFSSTTASTIVTTATRQVEETMQHIQTTTTTVNINHSGNHENGINAPAATKGVATEVSHGDGAALKGRAVVKKFSRKSYIGEIAGYDSQTKWYKVVYEDGDEEELEWKELEPILMPADVSIPANSKKKPLTISDTGGQEGSSEVKRTEGRKSARGADKSAVKSKPVDKATTPTKLEKTIGKEDGAQKPGTKKKEPGKKGQPTGKEDVLAEAEVSATHSTQKKAVSQGTPKDKKMVSNKVGRPKKDESKAPVTAEAGKKRKSEVKSGTDISSENKPITRRRSLSLEQDDSNIGGTLGAKAVVEPSSGASMIGAKTKKKFSGKYFKGEIIGFDPKAKFYKVQYEDGDEEELEWKEVQPTLVVSEDQAIPSKTRGQAAKVKGLESPQKKQKLNSPKQAAAKSQSPTESHRKGTQSTRRSHASMSESKGTDGDEDKYSDEDYDGDGINSHSRDEGSTAVASNGPSPAAAILATVRYASTDAAESLEYFGLGEVAQSNRSRCLELVATKLLPTSSPIAHLAVSQHHIVALTTAGHVLVWRNQHGNIHSRCGEWEHISDLENKGVVLIDIAGPDLDRKAGGYEPLQEDQVPDPFYLAAVCHNGEDFVLQGSQPQEYVRTRRLKDVPRPKGLRSALSQTNPASLKTLGRVIQASVGTVEAPDESPFIGYITDANQVYIRSATKNFMDEINLVTGYTGKPIKIQCGGVYHAIIMTDDNRAWTWGRCYFPAATIETPNFSHGNQSPYAVCSPALGTLVGRKVVDVGCYGDNFIALTSDGDVHQWTHNIPNPAAGVYNLPSTPVNGQGPTVADKDKLKSISIGVGVCAGVTELGKVHTWRTFMRGGFAGMQGSQKEPLTPLGRDEGAKDTTVASLGAKFAIKVICVAGSLIVVVQKKFKPKGRPKGKVSDGADVL